MYATTFSFLVISTLQLAYMQWQLSYFLPLFIFDPVIERYTEQMFKVLELFIFAVPHNNRHIFLLENNNLYFLLGRYFISFACFFLSSSLILCFFRIFISERDCISLQCFYEDYT